MARLSGRSPSPGIRLTPTGRHPKLALGCSGAGGLKAIGWLCTGATPNLFLRCSGAGLKAIGWLCTGDTPNLFWGALGLGLKAIGWLPTGATPNLFLGCSGAGGCKARSRLPALNSGRHRERCSLFEAGERIGGLSRRRLSCGSDDGIRSLGPTGPGNLAGWHGFQAFGLRYGLAAQQA